MFASLLVPLDLSPVSARVLDRVRRLPLAEGARVMLLHVVPRLRPASMRRRAETDARAALREVGRALDPALVQIVVTSGSPAAEIARAADEFAAELVVMGRAGPRVLRDVVLGSTAERVVRHAPCPVLAVRQPARGPYRQPLIALDDDDAAPEVLATALRLVPDAPPPLSIVHVYETPFETLFYPSLSGAHLERHRRHYRLEAAEKLAGVLERARSGGRIPGAGDEQWKLMLRHGSPRGVLPALATTKRADLVILGTHARAGISLAFLGTVAGDVLRDVLCDVLVVPPAPGARTR